MANLQQQLVLEKMLCPWWLAYTFDHRLRRVFHKPEVMFAPYLREGMTALDVGCGMGFFSIGMAAMIGNTGKVIAIDVQARMLEKLGPRAERAGVGGRIERHQCAADGIGRFEDSDFALSFWMLHEVPDQKRLLNDVYAALKPGAAYLLVEPKIHVTRHSYERSVEYAVQAGFRIVATPNISFSRATAFTK
jgi:ubiquinone/menaquinone biosynthesis C-methylase UbiE